jgi:hypothetical protein
VCAYVNKEFADTCNSNLDANNSDDNENVQLVAKDHVFDTHMEAALAGK